MRRLTFYEIGFSAFSPGPSIMVAPSASRQRLVAAISLEKLTSRIQLSPLGKSGTDKETMAHAFGRRGRYRSR